MSQFTGKTVIITGASRGIGEASVRHFAALGANVVLAARGSAAIEAIAGEINAAGGAARAIACDIANHEEVDALVTRTIDAFGRIDILVNNAGVIEPIAHIADSDPVEWGRVIDINTKGVFYGMRAVLPHMLGAGGGVIVNISSGAATSPLEGWSPYCASKAAALMLTRSAHLEYGARGIRVVGLSPGTVATEMQVVIKASGVNPVSRLDPSAHIPPEWVARGIAYLCTDDAAEFAGTDFTLKTPEGRARVGLPAA